MTEHYEIPLQHGEFTVVVNPGVWRVCLYDNYEDATEPGKEMAFSTTTWSPMTTECREICIETYGYTEPANKLKVEYWPADGSNEPSTRTYTFHLDVGVIDLDKTAKVFVELTTVDGEVQATVTNTTP